ncbi:MAG: Vitamin B12 transporter BtuB [Xylophilus sp.]|nr:MAG: Vitamin B12 transporter BtuB [Xylophilus sp.]
MQAIRSTRTIPFAPRPLVAALLTLPAAAVQAADAAPAVKDLGVITIQSGRPSSLLTTIPTTTESIDAEAIAERVNATDSEDALKYFPSLLVRKRYAGDYNHAILSSRASGTGNSARSAVYADGILLSNFLGNGTGGLGFPPRWGMFTPEEIERVDVMYGPFSAAYPGNSVGAVVDYLTRMPTGFEAHARIGYASQPFNLYATHATYHTWQASASLGNRQGDWSWWLHVDRTDGDSQPLTFATRAASTGAAPTSGTAASGAVADRNTAGAPVYVIGSGTQYHTRQDHLKAKVAYDITPTLRASYLLGVWQNDSRGRSASYLTNAATGQTLTSGPVVIDGRQYAALTGSDFALTNESLTHFMHGLSLKSNTQGTFDWEAAASLYDYDKDDKRQNGTAAVLPAALTGGPGTLADGSGTGWANLRLAGTWRPQGPRGTHVVDFGYQFDRYRLRYLTSNLASDWTRDAPGAPGSSLASQVGGRTQRQSLYGQDSWRFAPDWLAVLGLRSETWTARDGVTRIAAGGYDQTWAPRRSHYLSPKAALSYRWAEDTVLKASLGRAVRMLTVFELYGATSTTNSRYINDPNLRPERSWTGELSIEKDLGSALWRVTAFRETTRDALFSQSILDTAANATVTRVQNVGRIETWGLETSLTGENVLLQGLDLSGSLTYAESVIPRRMPATSACPATPSANASPTYRAGGPRSKPAGASTTAGRPAPRRATAAASSVRWTTATSTASPTWASRASSRWTCGRAGRSTTSGAWPSASTTSTTTGTGTSIRTRSAPTTRN